MLNLAQFYLFFNKVNNTDSSYRKSTLFYSFGFKKSYKNAKNLFQLILRERL